jgi:phage/plasmid-associated DNA primase
MLKYTKRNGCNSITYKKKEYGIGRFYPDSDSKNIYGYQNVQSKIRRLVVDGKLQSIDLNNAHVNILEQMCAKSNIPHEAIENYTINRDAVLKDIVSEYSVSKGQAKQLMLILTFGGSFDTWIRENKMNKNMLPLTVVTDYHDEIQLVMNAFAIKNFPGYTTAVKIAMEVKQKKHFKDAYRSALGLYLQDIESQIIMSIYDYLCEKEIKVHSLIHDELLIDPCELDLDAVMRNITAKTTFIMDLHANNLTPLESDLEWFDKHVKYFKTKAEKEERPDIQHAKNILNCCEMFSCKSLGVIMYDDRDGLWTNCGNRHIDIVQSQSNIIFPADENDKKKKDFLSLFNNAYKLASVMCPIIENLDVSKSKGFFLFNNGVLDLKKYVMLPKSPHYNFLDKINRDYTIDNYESLEGDIMTKLFDMPFTDTVKRDYFIQQIARGMAGHSEDRQFLFATGETACGKGTLTKLLKNTFTSYVTDFNNHHLVAKSGNQESELKWKWILDIWYKRMAICNEFDMSAEDSGCVDRYNNKIKTIKSIDGTTMKTLVSDGDTISCRGLFKDPIKVANNAFIMVLANDTPSVKPCDAAYLDRANCIHFNRSSSDECIEADDLFFPRDQTINDFIANSDVFDAFISLLSKYYNMDKLVKPECVITESKERSGADECGVSWISDNYEIMPKATLDTFRTKDGGFDLDKLDEHTKDEKDYFTVFDYIYQKYMKGGNVDSKVNVGKMLKRMGCETARKKISGKTIKVYVGIRSVYKPKRMCDIEDSA